MFNLRNHPAILAHFPIFDRFQKSKKTARLKREWLFFIKFSIKMPEFNRFPPKAYALGLRIFAWAAARRAIGTLYGEQDT